MKKILYSFVCLSLLFSCTNEQDQQKQKTTSDNSKTTSTVSAEQNDGIFSLTIDNIETSSGEEICVPIKGKNFNKIVSMQYTLRWDPNLLKFNRLTDFKLKALSANNFNAKETAKGQLAKSWFDPAIQGITINDGESIYSVCFETLGASGSESYIYFSGDPTIIEMSDPSGEINFKSEKSFISIK